MKALGTPTLRQSSLIDDFTAAELELQVGICAWSDGTCHASPLSGPDLTDYYPMPWTSLKYDPNLGGYRVSVTEDQLKGAPKYNRNTDWDWSDRARDRGVYDYYKTPLWY